MCYFYCVVKVVLFLPMFTVKTMDGHVMELEEHFAFKSYLFRSIKECPNRTGIHDPVEILVDKRTMSEIYSFMQRDNHIIKKDYNPLEIHFSSEMLHYFDQFSIDEILDVCNGANYLEYPFLLELCCKVLANELASNSKDLPMHILGDRRIDGEDLERIARDFDWVNEHI